MLILRLKRAECALADGRLDEAYALAVADDVRAHRRGQQLTSTLAQRLVERGRDHLAAGRLEEARTDSDRAARLGGNLPDVAQLRDAIASAIRLDHRQRQRAAAALDNARRQVAAGNLSIGQHLLASATGDTGALIITEQIQAQRLLREKLSHQAATALQQDNWEAALDPLRQALDSAPHDPILADLAAKAHRLAVPQLRQALIHGNLTLASAMLDRLDRLPSDCLDLEPLRRVVALSRSAWNALRAGQVQRAGEELGRISSLLPDAAWVRPALDAAGQAATAIASLRSGPLSMLEPATLDYPSPAVADSPANPAPHPMLPLPNGRALPPRLVLQVDGVGAFLLLTSPIVRIGARGRGARVDIELPAGSDAPGFEIERLEDDYFLRCARPLRVNDHPVSGKLLCTGDRIAPTPRSSLTFRLPSPASTTALLDLGGVRPPALSASRIILLDREIIIGPGPAAHIRDDQMPSPLLLCLRDGALFPSGPTQIIVNGSPLDRGSPIPLNVPIRAGETGFVISPA